MADYSQAAAVVLAGAFLEDVLQIDLRATAARGVAADGGHGGGARDGAQDEAVGGVAGFHGVVEDEEAAPVEGTHVALAGACGGEEGRP